MKVVIDTSVLVSAVLKDRAQEAVILFVMEQDDFEWIVSQEILTEYKDVLSRPKFGLSAEIQQQWFELLDRLTMLIDVDVVIDFPRDQKDAKFLACALTANAEFLITGDRDFIEAQRLVNTTIVSVSLFKQIFCESPS